MRIGNSVVVLAQSVPAGDYKIADGTTLKELPAFCRIFAVGSPHPSSNILIEIWMPTDEHWNGKLLGIGNGGAAGKIPSSALASGLRRGFATATTDLGSYPAGTPGISFNFGDGRPEARRDWGYRATHEMTLLAKQVVALYFGRSATKSYFIGCSTGGHQGLTEAQRYPEDYDGIIAGAPAFNRTHLHIRFAALRKLGMQPGAAIAPDLMAHWSNAILKACAGRDGGAPGDTFLTDPLLCTVSPRQLACKKTPSPNPCLTETQIGALDRVYSGTRNPRTGDLIALADVRGTETGLSFLYGDTAAARAFDMTHWILPPERSWSTFDFDRDVAAMDNALAADINAMNSNLSRFAARGGKLILYHGWMDAFVPPLDSIDYVERVRANSDNQAESVRLFMVPGMGHCASGPGATDFGQRIEARADATPDNDILLALDRWSEAGIAPEMLVARRAVQAPGSVAPQPASAGPASRPICAFPKLPRYNGTGDPDQASSFVCAGTSSAKFERAAPQYVR